MSLIRPRLFKSDFCVCVCQSFDSFWPETEMMKRKYLGNPPSPLSSTEHCSVRRLHHVQGLWASSAERPKEDGWCPPEDEWGAEWRQAQGECTHSFGRCQDRYCSTKQSPCETEEKMSLKFILLLAFSEELANLNSRIKPAGALVANGFKQWLFNLIFATKSQCWLIIFTQAMIFSYT